MRPSHHKTEHTRLELLVAILLLEKSVGTICYGLASTEIDVHHVPAPYYSYSFISFHSFDLELVTFIVRRLHKL